MDKFLASIIIGLAVFGGACLFVKQQQVIFVPVETPAREHRPLDLHRKPEPKPECPPDKSAECKPGDFGLVLKGSPIYEFSGYDASGAVIIRKSNLYFTQTYECTIMVRYKADAGGVSYYAIRVKDEIYVVPAYCVTPLK